MTNSNDIQKQIFATFTLLTITDDLLEKLEDADLRNVTILKYGLDELVWLRKHQEHIQLETMNFFADYNNHPLSNVVYNLLRRNIKQIEIVRQLLSETSREGICYPKDYQKNHNKFIRSLRKMSRYINHTYQTLTLLTDKIPHIS